MNVHGLNSLPGLAGIRNPRPEPIDEPRQPVAGGGTPVARTATPAPAQPPAREATLWEMLSPEEREFFTQQAQLGSLTYRRSGGPSADAQPLGQRLDVKA